MASQLVVNEKVAVSKVWYGAALLVVAALTWPAPQAFGKEPSLTAIELYDGPTGAAYVQLGDVSINGKAEMRDCSQSPGPSIDKSTYGKLPKLMLAVGGTLERGQDGVLRYTDAGRTGVCVVPANVKFEHNAAFSLSDLVDQGPLHGTPIGAAGDAAAGTPPLKKGVKLLFVAAPNVELAEYLRAQRAAEIEGWRAYVAKYPDSPHIADAKLALAQLYVAAANKSLDAYKRSVATGSASYADLKEAKSQADLAAALLPSLDTTTKVSGEIHAQLAAVTEKGRSELDAYHAALTAHSPGYAHLQNAKKLADAVAGIDSGFAPGTLLTRDVVKDSGAYDSALQSASSLAAGKQPDAMDHAVKTVQPYRAFAAEEPRLGALIDGMNSFYVERGAAAGQAQDWQSAVAEYQKAVAVKETPESQDALKNAKDQLVIAQNAAAAKAAMERSAAAEAQKDFIEAYEQLSSLTPAQQALVADTMKRLAPAYAQAAAKRAADLRKAHSPIQGIGDGYDIENAYTFLQHAFDLTQDDTYLDQMNLLGDELSAYFLSQANHYLAKPEGSGTEMAWAYLQEALSYKASNQTAVRDAKVGAEQAHSMHSKLSIQVQFRDGTSQRDSAGFAGQLENAIITGLEASSIPIRAIRFGESTSVKPDYQLIGDVLEHHISETPSPETLDSVYYTGSSQDEPNEEWNKANREYVAVSSELSTAQSALQGAEAKGNKKAIDELNNRVSLDSKKAADALARRDSITKDIKTPINHPYTYTKNTIDYKDTIRLQFRIGDILSGEMTEVVPLVKEDHQKVVVLEGVKAEDIQGVKPSGAKLDKTELLAALETAARDALIESVRARVEVLPKAIYENARKKETDGDEDGAAEAYLRYLNCARADDSPERAHAIGYLKTQFHLRPDTSAPLPGRTPVAEAKVQ